MSKAKDNMYLAMRWFDEHPNISIEEKVVIVYELWQNYRIDEDEEEELYTYVDPYDEVDSPHELWMGYHKRIPDIVSEQLEKRDTNS